MSQTPTISTATIGSQEQPTDTARPSQTPTAWVLTEPDIAASMTTAHEKWWAADDDGDGLTNQEELALGTWLREADSDGDGLSDFDEVRVYGTNPLAADTDRDGLRDDNEIATPCLNPTQADSDADQIPDASDPDSCSPASATPTSQACQQATGPRWGGTLYAQYQEQLRCPTSGEIRTGGAFQLYQRGLMVWRQDADRLYVLYYNGRYVAYPDNSPAGYYDSDLLKGGFGYLWNNDSAVRNGLGSALSPEAIASQFAAQDFDTGTIFYFYENQARNYVLFATDGSWVSTGG